MMLLVKDLIRDRKYLVNDMYIDTFMQEYDDTDKIEIIKLDIRNYEEI